MDTILESNGWELRLTEPTPEEAFGPDFTIDKIGRESCLEAIYHTLQNHISKGMLKVPAYYFHASPGLGKTFLLKELLRKKTAEKKGMTSEKVFFFVPLDFNCCKEVDSLFQSLESLRCYSEEVFCVARIFYVQFIEQGKVSWPTFFEAIVNHIL